MDRIPRRRAWRVEHVLFQCSRMEVLFEKLLIPRAARIGETGDLIAALYIRASYLWHGCSHGFSRRGHGSLQRTPRC